MLVLVVLLLVRVCLQSIACWWCCLLTGFVCTLLHVSHGSVAPCQGLSALYCMLVMVVLPACQGLSALYCMLVMVVCLLSGFVCTLLHVSHGSVAPCQGLSALYCMLVMVVCLLSGFVCTLLHVSQVVCLLSGFVCTCSLLLLMLLLVRVCLHSIAC